MHNPETQKHTPSVTVAIPAHNEEKNIVRLLNAVVTQCTNNFRLEAIVVMCDGCTDTTASLARAFSVGYPVVHVVEDGKRMGKIGRLNELYGTCTSDIIVMFDADIVPQDIMVIEELVKGFTTSAVGLVGGIELPHAPESFRERMFVTWSRIWLAIRRDLDRGISVHNHAGCVSAIHKSVYRDLVMPTDVVAEDEFLFFQTYRVGKVFNVAPRAVVYYHSPKTFREYFVQSSRYLGTKRHVADYFGTEVEYAYRVPVTKKIRAIFMVFVHDPLFTIGALVLQIPIRIMQYFYNKKAHSGFWQVAQTTK